MNKLQGINEQIDEVDSNLHNANTELSALRRKLVHDPKGVALKEQIAAITTRIRNLNAEKTLLEEARAEAIAYNQSEAVQVKRTAAAKDLQDIQASRDAYIDAASRIDNLLSEFAGAVAEFVGISNDLRSRAASVNRAVYHDDQTAMLRASSIYMNVIMVGNNAISAQLSDALKDLNIGGNIAFNHINHGDDSVAKDATWMFDRLVSGLTENGKREGML